MKKIKDAKAVMLMKFTIKYYFTDIFELYNNVIYNNSKYVSELIITSNLQCKFTFLNTVMKNNKKGVFFFLLLKIYIYTKQ